MNIEGLLSRCFLFHDLTPAQLHVIAGTAAAETHLAGDAIFSAGNPGSAMYIVASGSVIVEKDGIELARLGAGSHFGEIALLDGEPRSATVRSAERSEVVALPRDRFQAALDADPGLAATVYRAFCRYLSARLRHTNEQTVFFREKLER